MKRSLMLRAFVILLIGVFAGAMLLPRWQVSVASASPPTEREIEQLIEKLGSARFEEREEATHKLSKMEGAKTRLDKALRSADLEVRRRAADILAEFERMRALRGLNKAKTLGKDGRVIEMVDRLVHWSKWDTGGEGWSALTQFTGKLIDLTPRDVLPRLLRENIERFPAGDFRRYVDAIHPKEISGRKLNIRQVDGFRLVRGERVAFGTTEEEIFLRGIIVASENASVSVSLWSVIISGGNLKVVFLGPSIIICDGDVEVSDLRGPCIIIARGKVTCRHGNFGMVQNPPFSGSTRGR